MVSKKDLLCMFQYLDGNVSALEDELKELRKDLDKVKRNNKCKFVLRSVRRSKTG